MGKFFSIIKNQGAVLITMLVLIMLGAAYFYIYIPDNEKNVQDRHFRCLQNIDQNVHNKIENSTKLIDSLLASYNKINTDSLNNYIKHYPTTFFKLLPIKITKKTNQDNLITIVSDANSKEFSLYADKKFPYNKFARKDTSLLDSIEHELVQKKGTGSPGDSVELEIGIRYNIKQFIQPLLTPGVFDHYVVFYNDKENQKDNNEVTNKVVFETFPSGLSYLKKDSLLQTRNGIVTPGIRALNLSGRDYKVFTQAINVDATSEFIVAGLVTDRNYQKEKNQLPSWLVLLLLTLALGTVVSLPWIKLYHMGNKDKLTVADGISSILVSMLLMSLLFFVIFKYTFSLSLCLKTDKEMGQNSADRLGDKIETSFDAELDNAYKTLVMYQCVYRDFRHNIVNLEKPGAGYSTSNTKQSVTDSPISKYQKINKYDADTLLKPNPQDIKVREVYWIDKDGTEQENWNTENYNSPQSSYKDRKYFNSLKKDSFNYRGNHLFYLDQVISKTRSVFTSIIAIKPTWLKKDTSNKKNISVAAMTFTAKSLENVIMPDGFQFAIINDRGLVLYHSKTMRNLNENLETEFADNKQLTSCIEAGSNAGFEAQYYGKQYYVKVRPLKNLPYFLVVFEDLEYNDARDTEPYAFTLSMFICFMVLVLIQHGLVFFASSKRSFFKKQYFDTSWVAPNLRSHHQYNLAIIANVLIVVWLLIFFCFSSFLGYLFNLLFSVLLSAAFLTGLFALKYNQNGDPRSRFKIKALICLLVLKLILDIAASITLDAGNFALLFLFQIVSLASCFLIYKREAVFIGRVKMVLGRYLAKWDHTYSFALMATSRLVITSGIPVAFFFIFSFNYEQNLDARYRQLSFATIVIQKISPADLETRWPFILNAKANPQGIYPDSVYIDKNISVKTIDINFTDEIAGLKESKEDHNTVKVLDAFRLLMNNTELMSNNLGMPPADGVTYFNKITYLHTPGGFTTRTYYKLGSNSKKYLMLKSGDINYPVIRLLFWLMLFLVGALFAYYFIILNILRKLFALNLPPIRNWDSINDDLLRDNKLNQLLLMVGPPGSGKLSKLKKLICEGNLYGNEIRRICDEEPTKDHRKTALLIEDSKELPKNVFVADMILIPVEPGTTDDEWVKCKKDALSKTNAMVIINHFEYNIKDANVNRIKLDFLEMLIQPGACKVIIISTVHPLTFLDSFSDEQYINDIADTSKKPGVRQTQNHQIPQSELERWHVLLGHFRIIIQSLEKSASITQTNTLLEKYIFEETQYAHYLKHMRKIIEKNLPVTQNIDVDELGDSMAFNLQITSHYFYTYIWQSLTKEEKFILYDLAEDGLVNSYDDYNLVMLIRKGLVIRPEGVLKIFNKGFRNFILTAIGNAEVERIKDQVKDTGKWNSLKAPLTLAIISVLIFLMTSQQEAFTHVIAYITTLGAGVPAILSIFSLFGRSSGQKAS